jgi:hypothetical protein
MTASPIAFSRRVPSRVSAGRWYFIETDLMRDGQVGLQSFEDGHGEVCASPPTASLLRESKDALAHVMSHYAEARRSMPKILMVDVTAFDKGRNMIERRASYDPIEQLRREVDALLQEMLTHDERPSPNQLQLMAVRYGRLRDRFAQLRATFTHVEGAFDVLQTKMVHLFDDGANGDV